MKKRLLSILLCTAMVASLAVGCGGNTIADGWRSTPLATLYRVYTCKYKTKIATKKRIKQDLLIRDSWLINV